MQKSNYRDSEPTFALDSDFIRTELREGILSFFAPYLWAGRMLAALGRMLTARVAELVESNRSKY